MRLIFEYGYNLAFHCPHRNGWPHSLKVHYITLRLTHAVPPTAGMNIMYYYGTFHSLQSLFHFMIGHLRYQLEVLRYTIAR